MKRILILAVLAVSMTIVSTSSAEAAGRRSGYRQNSNVITKIIELEKRKNAALRRMFFGN